MLSEGKVKSQGRAVVKAAAHVLGEALLARRPADRVLAAYLRERHEIGSRDRRIISELTYAVFRWWGWLQRLAPAPLLTAWRDGLASPAGGTYAAADATAVREIVPESWVPLLLATLVTDGLDAPELRAVWCDDCGLRNRPELVTLAGPTPAARAAAVLHLLGQRDAATLPPQSELLPEWAAAQIASFRPLVELIGWLQRRPPLWLRIQNGTAAAVVAELSAAGLRPEVSAAVSMAVRTDNTRVNLFQLPVYREGRVEVQDLASQCIGLVCAPQSGQRWWDCCAGAGGKSLELAQLMDGKGVVVASDVREYKLEDLRRRARRAGFSNITGRPWDGKPLAPRKAVYDGVLVDAPCSCSGTWRRNPAARWSTLAAEVAELVQVQTQVLHAAASGVKPGGVLVYATCSLFAAENDGVVGPFLAAHPDFALEPFPHPLVGATTAGTVQLWPWDGDCDAMFAARFRRAAAC